MAVWDDMRQLLLEASRVGPVKMLKYAAVLAVLVLSHIPCLKLAGKVYYYCGWERKRDMALSQGHEITAKLIKGHNDHIDYSAGGSLADCHPSGIYEYMLNGETKRYHAGFQGCEYPPKTLALYYINNPNRMFSVDESHLGDGLRFLPGFLVSGLPWVLAAVTVILLGLAP